MSIFDRIKLSLAFSWRLKFDIEISLLAAEEILDGVKE